MLSECEATNMAAKTFGLLLLLIYKLTRSVISLQLISPATRVFLYYIVQRSPKLYSYSHTEEKSNISSPVWSDEN